jgi:hypothetical protein
MINYGALAVAQHYKGINQVAVGYLFLKQLYTKLKHKSPEFLKELGVLAFVCGDRAPAKLYLEEASISQFHWFAVLKV